MARTPVELARLVPCLLCHDSTYWSDGLCSPCTTRMAKIMTVHIPEHIPLSQEYRFMQFKVKQLLIKEQEIEVLNHKNRNGR